MRMIGRIKGLTLIDLIRHGVKAQISIESAFKQRDLKRLNVFLLSFAIVNRHQYKSSQEGDTNERP